MSLREKLVIGVAAHVMFASIFAWIFVQAKVDTLMYL